MFVIPLYIFLLIYIFFVLGAVIFFFFDLYHLIASGELTLISLTATIIIGTLLLLVILFTWYSISQSAIDWSAPFSLLQGNSEFPSF